MDRKETQTFDMTKSTIAASKIQNNIPTAYRLIMMPNEAGGLVPVLQGYFTWQQGCKFGGEWKILKTQVFPNLSDGIPFGNL